MRKFQRVAVVAAAIAGLSALGGGVSFAHDHDDHGRDDDGVTALANSQSNAVAYDDDSHSGRHGSPDAAPAITPTNGFDLGNITTTTPAPSK
ncbi:hypothetical protein GCM10022403_033420 [Streptomyces coacervatus]|uniref:Secreted protein n=1 Tax=Streptomyces coacervatus TaxID=647381 RepID=A0ABP7HSQ3_9ACTN|nr:hypothetical protein [Streptomyces coacervatus]MDF2272329.1 hypothetical protein [Streptomyces coacervatus]